MTMQQDNFYCALLKLEMPSQTAETLALHAAENSISPSHKRKLVANFKQNSELINKATSTPAEDVFTWTTLDMRSDSLKEKIQDYSEKKRKWRTIHEHIEPKEDAEDKEESKLRDAFKDNNGLQLYKHRAESSGSNTDKHAPDSCDSDDIEEGSDYDTLFELKYPKTTKQTVKLD